MDQKVFSVYITASFTTSLLVSFAGTQSQHEASVQPDHGASVPALYQAGQIQEAALLALLLPLRSAGEEKVPHAGMEHCLRIQ